MNLATQRLRYLALQLIAEESIGGTTPQGSSAVPVCEKLCGQLSRIAGEAGAVSLLSRALALARAEVPWLNTVKVVPNAKLEGFVVQKTGTDECEKLRGGVILVAQLFGLLHAIIGEPLTWQLLKETWPKAAFHITSQSTGTSSDRTKVAIKLTNGVGRTAA